MSSQPSHPAPSTHEVLEPDAPASKRRKLEEVTCELCKREPLKQVSDLEERFGITGLETKDAAKAELAIAATTLAEATLVSVVTDGDLSKEAKQRKIQKQIEKVSNWSRDFGSDIKMAIHPAIISATVGRLMT